MKKLLLVLPLLCLPAMAHAQRFPYRSAVFFRECAHLSESRHNEPNDELVTDISCARYIEGFEMAYFSARNLPETCLSDPLSLFIIAAADYQRAPQPDELPTQYLTAAILARCNH